MKRKGSKFNLKNATQTLTSNQSQQCLTSRIRHTGLEELSTQQSDHVKPKKITRFIKQSKNSAHDRSKSNLRGFTDAIVQASESIKRSLLNFKTDLLGLRHDERYSLETENLVKLIHKYTDKLSKIDQRYKLRVCLESGAKSPTTGLDDYYENENFSDIISEQNKKYRELSKKYTFLCKQNEELLQKYLELEEENHEQKRKLEINTKHVQLENVFTKLGALLLSSKVDDNLNLKFTERQMIKDLFGGKLKVDNFYRNQT